MRSGALVSLLAILFGAAVCLADPPEQPKKRSLTDWLSSASASASKRPDAEGAAPAKASAAPTLRSLDEMLLFYPAKYPRGNWQPRDLAFEDVRFNAQDGTRLHGWYCPAKGSARASLLYLHGNGGNVTARVPILALFQSRLRLNILIVDYRGYGRSDGVPTVEGVLQDARAARTWLAQRDKIEESRVVLLGNSLGGAIAVQLASESPARGLVLENTFSSMREVAQHHYPALAWLVPQGRLNSAARIAAYHGPLLQSHGDGDRVVPFDLGKKLFEAANEPKQFVRLPGMDHNDMQPAHYFQALDAFIAGLR